MLIRTLLVNQFTRYKFIHLYIDVYRTMCCSEAFENIELSCGAESGSIYNLMKNNQKFGANETSF